MANNQNSNQTRPPLGANLGPVEWVTIIATCLTIIGSIATIAYLYGVFTTRVVAVETLVKEANDDVESIKNSMNILQSLKDEVGRLREDVKEVNNSTRLSNNRR